MGNLFLQERVLAKMPRYKLTIEYDGTGYAGWQRQKNLMTVQGAIEEAFFKFSQEIVILHASGRTDTGVHARGQVAHVDLQKTYQTYQVRNAVNSYLGQHSIRIIDVEAVNELFHARFSSLERRYLYLILNRVAPSALERYRVWHVYKPLKAELMHEAAQYLLGQHDFSTFRASECQSLSPIKTLDQLEVIRRDDYIEIFARARSFLHHQVRNMVGALKLVGEGKWSVKDFRNAFEACDRRRGGIIAPSQGLYFMGVTYPSSQALALSSFQKLNKL
jgi:tRNA pseudouridine38-40 synthase